MGPSTSPSVSPTGSPTAFPTSATASPTYSYKALTTAGVTSVFTGSTVKNVALTGSNGFAFTVKTDAIVTENTGASKYVVAVDCYPPNWANIGCSSSACTTAANNFKTAFQEQIAIKLSINANQIPTANIVLTQGGGGYTGRHAHALADSTKVTADVLNCGSSGSGSTACTNAGGDDDEFPGWAIALCVVLPLLAIGGAAAAYFLLSGDGGAAEMEAEIKANEPVAPGPEDELATKPAEQIAEAAAQPEGQV